MIKKNVAADSKDLLKRINNEFPELSWRSYKHITVGWDHDVIILDDNIVFRFPNDDQYAVSLSMEIEVLRRLKPLVKINIPNYVYIAKDNSFAGYPIVPGGLLSKELFDHIGISQRTEITRQLAETLTILHTLILKGQNFEIVPGTYMYKDQKEIKLQADQYLGKVLADRERATVNNILGKVDDLLDHPLPVTFIHGDVYSQHLLWDEHTTQLGLIDFSDMARADPAIDFAELYEYGEAFVCEVYDAYKGPKDDTFLDRAWIYQCWVGVYMLTDYFVYHKTSFEVARQTFDRIKLGRR
jgi:aminoglycoside phosphotransferase (APT) family kinase protein